MYCLGLSESKITNNHRILIYGVDKVYRVRYHVVIEQSDELV